MELDLENPLTNFFQDLHSDTIPSLFFTETDHMPSGNYFLSLETEDFDATFRTEAVSLISQFSYNYDPFLSYLAVNYLDRFLSSQGMPQGKAWILRLLAVSCVSLAAKMKKTEFSVTDFQCDEGFIFDTQTVQRMEVLILGALKWRMRSITPFSFINFFLSLFKPEDPPLREALKARATEIILKAQNEIKLLEFKPSIIAASALLSASHELFPLQFPCFRKAISDCSYVNKENMLKCCNTMQDILISSYEIMLNMVSSSDTPVNVLDRHYSSSESEHTAGTEDITATTTTTTAATTIIRPDRDKKRRRMGESCKDNKFHLS
ncbi:hypothetical protein L1049_024016 [Liquidambar formosana]|uniref:B-like cyclin n=1 Tax=Liquidambar formosana TaxID=63359 RepID=A0AAP0S016_LIQFO